MKQLKKENQLIEKYAERWNKVFYYLAGDNYVGRANVEKMLNKFLRAYKKEFIV